MLCAIQMYAMQMNASFIFIVAFYATEICPFGRVGPHLTPSLSKIIKKTNGNHAYDVASILICA
jgi:hypothetical protein